MPGESVRLGMAVVPIRLWVSTNDINNTGMAPAGTKKVCRHHRLGGSAPAHAGEEYASSYLLTVVGTADNWRRNGQDELETELVRDPVGFWRMAVLAWAPLPRPGSSLRPSTLAVRPSILLSIPSTRSPVLTVKVPTLSLNSRWSLTNSFGVRGPRLTVLGCRQARPAPYKFLRGFDRLFLTFSGRRHQPQDFHLPEGEVFESGRLVFR